MRNRPHDGDSSVPIVLIVEDDPDVREFVHLVLQREGYETTEAANGVLALQEMHRRKPDVVVLDLMMPVMDGWTFRRHQLEEPALASVPVICVTAFHEPDRAAATMNAPCLQKPVDLDDLLHLIQDACSRPKG